MTRSAERTPRARGDDGTAIVEFAFISILLSLLVFGIINFGLILSFKQDMTRAAAEGARAGAVALPSTVAGENDPRRLAAVTALEEAVDGFDRTCALPGDVDYDGLICRVQIHDCNYTISAGDIAPAPDAGYHGNADPDCVTTRLIYDYDEHPLLARLPLLEATLPDLIEDSSVARLNS